MSIAISPFAVPVFDLFSNSAQIRVSTMREPKASQSKIPSDAGASDGQLVRDALNGHRPAFDVLIRRYQRQAIAVSYRLLGNIHDAMEVTQDAFLKSFSSLGTLQKPEAFGGWLMRIVSNLSLNYRRGRKSRAHLQLDDGIGHDHNTDGDPSTRDQSLTHEADPLHRLQSAEMGEKLVDALRHLPEMQRLAITLFTIEQLPQKEVARMLHCSVEAVKWHVFQGRKRLKHILKEHL